MKKAQKKALCTFDHYYLTAYVICTFDHYLTVSGDNDEFLNKNVRVSELALNNVILHAILNSLELSRENHLRRYTKKEMSGRLRYLLAKNQENIASIRLRYFISIYISHFC